MAKKVLILLGFFVLGSVSTGALVFLALSLTSKPKVDEIEQSDNTQTPVVDESEEIAFDDGYYTVTYDKCGLTFPFPEAVGFEYLNTSINTGRDPQTLDSNLGWHITDFEGDGTGIFGGLFENNVRISLVPLPYTTQLGGSYVSASVFLSCDENSNKSLSATLEEIKDELSNLSTDMMTFEIIDEEESTYGGYDSIEFKVRGGMSAENVYILVRNDENIYIVTKFGMSEDAKISETEDYIMNNFKF